MIVGLVAFVVGAGAVVLGLAGVYAWALMRPRPIESEEES